jgi:hypothetical protein
LIETEERGAAAVFARVAIDPLGNAIAVWQQSDGTRRTVWANRFNGSEWGTAGTLEGESETNGSQFPEVAVDATDGAAVWSLGGGPQDAWANTFVPGSGWGAADLLEMDALATNNARIAVGGGVAIAVWDQSDGNYTNIMASVFQ